MFVGGDKIFHDLKAAVTNVGDNNTTYTFCV